MAESQSSYHSLESEVLDLRIGNLQKDKEIILLKRRISELESVSFRSTESVQPSVQVAHISSHGKVQLDVCDTAKTALYSRVPSSRLGTDLRENKVVKIETQKHASSFHFEKRDEWMRKLKSEVTDLPDEMRRRNCLAKAVRQNCSEITRDIPMQEGLFLDQLFSASCLDEEDMKMVSGSRKNDSNQLRAVIVVVLKKDFSVILALVSCIREINNMLGEKIRESYQSLASSGLGVEEKCWVCLLKTRVKFATYVDHLMKESLIDDEVYMETSREDLAAADRQTIFVEMFKQLMCHNDTRKVMQCLRTAIDNSGVHHDIVNLMSQEIDKENCSLYCGCGPQMQPLKPSEFENDVNKDSGNNTFLLSENGGALASPPSNEGGSSGFDDS